MTTSPSALGTYTQKAIAIAAGSGESEAQGCPSCVKAGLPVLLTRPGLADKQYALQKRRAVAPLLPGVADPALRHAGYVMRTLRKGYLFAYYEEPHTPQITQQQGWQAFRVDDGGFMSPHAIDDLPLDGQEQDTTFSCERVAGYASAMLFVIPDAKNTGRVWVGFSDHPWSEKVRQSYAGSESLRQERMVCINAREASCERAVPLTTTNLESTVADYDPERPFEALRGSPFPPLVPSGGFLGIGRTLPFLESIQLPVREERASDVLEQAGVILGRDGNQFSPADVKIVSLPDPVGVTFEAAQRRITLCNTAAEWVNQQANGDTGKAHWMLTSAMSVEGLLIELDRSAESRKAGFNTQYPEFNAQREGRGPGIRMTHEEFRRKQESGELPPEATFDLVVPYTGMSSKELEDYRNNISTVRLPTNSSIDRETERLKKNVLDKLEPGNGGQLKYKEFLTAFNDKVKEDQLRLAELEADYFAWLDCTARKQVTANDFDEECIVDGVFYCDCVSKLTFAGHLTDNGLEWYKNFLTDDPEDKENLLLRALLGNQKSAFEEWVAKKKGPYGQLKSIIGEVEKALKDDPEALGPQSRTIARWLPHLKIGLTAMVSPVLTVTGAVATGLAKRDEITAAFREQLRNLSGVIAARSSGNQLPALLKVQMSLSDATRFWNRQMGTLQGAMRTFAGQVRGDKVQSLVLGGAIALEARGASAMSDALVDVYLWASDVPDAVGDALDGAMDLPSRAASGASAGAAAMARAGNYILRPAAANLNQAWQGAARLVTRTQLDRLARNSVTLASNGSALLAVGSGVFSSLALLDAWDKFKHGSAEERQQAGTSLLTSGLGLSGAFLALGAEMAEQAAKEALKASLKKAAGIVGAAAALIDGAASVVGAFESSDQGDSDVAAAKFIQGVFLIGAGVAGMAAAFGLGKVALLGLSVTGWGLVLVALGIIAGFFVAALQDTPTEEWAARSLWGKAKDKWGSFEREQGQLNTLMLGIQVDFDFRSRFTNMSNYGRSLAHQVNPLNMVRDAGKLIRGERPGPQMMREAWARIVTPQALENHLCWLVRVIARRKDGKDALVANYSHRPGDVVLVAARRDTYENDMESVNPDQDDSKREDDFWTVELSAQLDIEVYEEAWAEVLIYGDPTASEAPLVNHTLREE
ncbi:T6SS effector BTH_I2691 family protein [Alloalcanivorax xenomutans]|uniref:T6SS effector BTH_I2691 family protein n=1 Tax=Alloalcanivorax xenomutans TaxID=1094342 RepID=UPI003C6215C2